MQTPHLKLHRPEQPNLELLRRDGWNVGLTVGRYCVIWRGREEIVLVWGDDGWQQVSGRGDVHTAA